MVGPGSLIMLAPNPSSPREAGVCKAGWPAVQIQDDVESARQESRRRSDLSLRRQCFGKIRIPRETGSEPFFDKSRDSKGRELFFQRANR